MTKCKIETFNTKDMKKITTLIKKHYPPVVLFITIAIGFLILCGLLSGIEKITTDLPVQYR